MRNLKAQHGKSLGTSESNEVETLELNKEDSFKPIVHKIDGLPFGIAQTGKEEYKIIFGKYLIDEQPYNSLEEAKLEAHNVTWIKILNVIGIINEYHESLK